MMTEVRPLQPKKVSTPILVTLLGMVMVVRLLQFQYSQLIVYQFVLIKTVEK